MALTPDVNVIKALFGTASPSLESLTGTMLLASVDTDGNEYRDERVRLGKL